jgi:acyl carrier protein
MPAIFETEKANSQMEGIEQKIRSFVIDNLLFGQEGTFSNEDSFLENGMIDSMGILSLVEYVTETFGVAIGDTEIVPENWDSVNRIARFVQTKVRSVQS